MSDLVQIENPPCGWMQNCNCSPAAMMNQDQPRHEQFSEYPHIYNESPSPRRASTRRDDDRPARTPPTRSPPSRRSRSPSAPIVWRAERWQARLKEAWKTASAADKSGDANQVYTLIQEWNRQSEPDSQGALAYYAFKKALGGEAAGQTDPPASLTDEQLLEATAQGGGVD